MVRDQYSRVITEVIEVERTSTLEDLRPKQNIRKAVGQLNLMPAASATESLSPVGVVLPLATRL